MSKKQVIINGVNFTDYCVPVGYNVSYKKIRGNSAGYMQDGSYTDDVISTKAIINLKCMPLTESQLQAVVSAISSTYVSAYFYDPSKNEYRTAEMMPSEPSQYFRGTGADGEDRWIGTEIVLTER